MWMENSVFQKEYEDNIVKVKEIAMEIQKDQLIVYGVGAHLVDMLKWHPDLAAKIVKVIDKDEDKIGKLAEGLSVKVESPEVLKDLPEGTEIAISDIRYYDDIVKELLVLNPGLICQAIDVAYEKMSPLQTKSKFLLWVDKQTSLDKVELAFENLLKLGKIQVVQIIGVTGEEVTDIVINGKKMTWISKEEIGRIDFDWLLCFEGERSFFETKKRAKEFGVEESKLIPGSAVCIPGFTPERYRKLGVFQK